MLKINSQVFINEAEITLTYIASPGPGGQNVNKLATGVVLRFNVYNTRSLPDDVRLRLSNLLSNKITTQGDLLIKATRYRTQERNKQDAMSRLVTFVSQAITPPKKRKKTRPTLGSIKRRITDKKNQSVKKNRRRTLGE